MNTLSRRAAGALLFWLCLVPAFGADYLPLPSDPDATTTTVNLYRYLATRRDQTSNKMIEGQHLGGVTEVHADENDGHTPPLEFSILNHAIDNRLPGMAGSRYDANDKTLPGSPYVLDPSLCTQINNRLISYWNQYQSIAHITATPRNPWNQASGRDPFQTGNNLSELLNPDAPNPSSAHQNFWNDIDTIATALQQLAAQDIPVVFRPFAEFNMTNKYYFVGQSPAVFVELWKQVYDYYTIRKGLHNLLFCWEVWALNRGDGAANVSPWYPGPAHVDVVAGAYYFRYDLTYVDSNGVFSLSRPNDQAIFNFLVAQERPFGAAQFGLNYEAPGGAPGDHNLALAFMDFAPSLAFAYYWKGYIGLASKKWTPIQAALMSFSICFFS